MTSFERFRAAYEVHASKPFEEANIDALPGVDEDLRASVATFGGKSFNRGIYRAFTPKEILEYTEIAGRLYNKLPGRVTVFGCDWLGRLFAVDTDGLVDRQALVLLLETERGKGIAIDLPVVEFYNQVLVEDADEVLAKPFFEEWRRETNLDIGIDECVGYKVPVFLGGEDELANLEVSDRAVYTEMLAQLRAKVRNMKEGQKVGQVTVKD